MIMWLYRLVYKSGSFGAWTDNKEHLVECVELFGSDKVKIEEKFFENVANS